MQCAQGEQSGGMCTWRRRWAGPVEGSYDQEAVAVEEDEEMEREDERGVAKRPDLNELSIDVPEWAELALSASPSRDGDSEPQAAGRAQRLGCGVRLGARRSSQKAQLTKRQSGACTTPGLRTQAGCGRRLVVPRLISPQSL
jgi:hypothetical protein